MVTSIALLYRVKFVSGGQLQQYHKIIAELNRQIFYPTIVLQLFHIHS